MKSGIPAVSLFFLFSLAAPLYPQIKQAETKSIALPAPQTDGGKPLMQALKTRQSTREYSTKEVGAQELSNLLWAANGISRPGSGKRTSPSAMNLQEIEIYISKADGLYLYNAGANALEPVLREDLRGLTGTQPFVKTAPLNLILVADLAKMKKSGRMNEENINYYSTIDAGYVSQNIYLYCASEGLVTVVRGSFDRQALTKAMKLDETKKIIICQTVGYPSGKKKD